MPIPNSPPVLPMPIAHSGDASDIPVSTPTGTGQLSFQAGFPFITQVPLLAGGIAPSRTDFNAVMKLLSQHTFFAQSGGVYPWIGADGDFGGLNYLQGCRIFGADGRTYQAAKPSGPDIFDENGPVGPKNPVTEGAYWNPLYWLQILGAPLDLYVSTSGSDLDGDGSEGKPFATLGHAVRFVAIRYMLSYNVYIHMGSGTFPESISLPAYNASGGQIHIVGAGRTATVLGGDPTADHTVYSAAGATYRFTDMTIRSGLKPTGGHHTCIRTVSGTVQVGDVDLDCPVGSALALAIWASDSSRVIIGTGTSAAATRTNIRLTDPASCAALYAASGATIYINNNITINGVVQWYTAGANGAARIIRHSTYAPVISGSVTGTRYAAFDNGSISTYGGGPNYFPGTVAGSTSSGGVYS